ncbi:MAG: hypothetical protein ACI8X5_002862 [Planctomycetota bacterium]|jgi:hypothetical protein
MNSKGQTESFSWSECAGRLSVLSGEYDLALEPEGKFFVAQGIRVIPPPVFPLPAELLLSVRDPQTAQETAARRLLKEKFASDASTGDLERYLQFLPEEPGLQCLILLQAGAVSVGMFEGGAVLAHKTMKRYVVRGKGRAQPTYLAAKGKSRYGSRLRLQNARLLFEMTNEKLANYWDEYGEPEHIFINAPRRLWADMFRSKIPPPFSSEHPIIRVPKDLPVPKTEVLLRTYKGLCYGRIERDFTR